MKLDLASIVGTEGSKVVIEPDRQDGLAVEKIMNLVCAFAQITTDRGYRYFKTDERAKLSGGRGSMRITFYSTPPDGIPVATKLLAEGNPEQADMMIAAIDAEEFIKVCELMTSQTQIQNKR